MEGWRTIYLKNQKGVKMALVENGEASWGNLRGLPSSIEGPAEARAHKSGMTPVYMLWAFCSKTFSSPGYGHEKGRQEN
jgi:hypothetical protein